MLGALRLQSCCPSFVGAEFIGDPAQIYGIKVQIALCLDHVIGSHSAAECLRCRHSSSHVSLCVGRMHFPSRMILADPVGCVGAMHFSFIEHHCGRYALSAGTQSIVLRKVCFGI